MPTTSLGSNRYAILLRIATAGTQLYISSKRRRSAWINSNFFVRKLERPEQSVLIMGMIYFQVFSKFLYIKPNQTRAYCPYSPPKNGVSERRWRTQQSKWLAAMRLGANICVAHTYHCGKRVERTVYTVFFAPRVLVASHVILLTILS